MATDADFPSDELCRNIESDNEHRDGNSVVGNAPSSVTSDRLLDSIPGDAVPTIGKSIPKLKRY